MKLEVLTITIHKLPHIFHPGMDVINSVSTRRRHMGDKESEVFVNKVGTVREVLSKKEAEPEAVFEISRKNCGSFTLSVAA